MIFPLVFIWLSWAQIRRIFRQSEWLFWAIDELVPQQNPDRGSLILLLVNTSFNYYLSLGQNLWKRISIGQKHFVMALFGLWRRDVWKLYLHDHASPLIECSDKICGYFYIVNQLFYFFIHFIFNRHVQNLTLSNALPIMKIKRLLFQLFCLASTWCYAQ